MDWSSHPVAMMAEQEAANERATRVAMLMQLYSAGIVSGEAVAEAAGMEYGGGDV